MSWVYTVLGFAALIVLHEFGHFIVAKAVGMRVERFSLGFGRLLIKVRRGETEYGIAPFPLGGYVKITGMNPYELEPAAAGAGAGEAQGGSSIRGAAGRLAVGAPKQLPADLRARAYYNQPVWKRISVILAGPLMNVLVAFLILWGVFAWHGVAQALPRVARVTPGSPAAAVLRPGDEVLSIDGQRGSVDSLVAVVSRHRCPGVVKDGCRAGTPVVLKVRRGDRLLSFRVTPRYSAAARRPLLGFQYASAVVPLGTGAAARESVKEMGHVIGVTVSKVAQIFTSSSARKQVHSIVGASDVLHQGFSYDAADAFFLLAIISLSLAIINLFPFLPLDGGHIFWAMAEKVRGRPIPFSVMERASVIGIALVMFVFLVGFTNDINTLTNGGFRIR